MSTSQTKKDETRRDWIKVLCMVGTLVVSVYAAIVSNKAEKRSIHAENTSIRAENLSKNFESAVSKLSVVSGPAGINQSGGSGSFNIGDMKVGTGSPQPPRSAGLEGAKTTFSGFGNRELTIKALELVVGIRELANGVDDNSRTNMPFSSEFLNATNQAEKEKAWAASGTRSQKFWHETKRTYNSRFKIDAILIRDELRARLPKSLYSNDQLYEDPSLTEFHALAGDLEKLAKLLPQ